VKCNNPSSATPAVENPTKHYKIIVNNFDYQRQHSGDTNIESIIVDVYYNCHFKPGGEWSFTTIKQELDSRTMQSIADVIRALCCRGN
jgi:hypothetical protein